jgi:uncharacterized repeat protein (TIGR02543 family)
MFAQTVKNIGLGSHIFCVEFRMPYGEIIRSTVEIKIEEAVSAPQIGGMGGGGNSSPAPSYSIVIETNGGTPIDNFSVYKGHRISADLSGSTREGFTFDGWFKDAELTEQFNPSEIISSAVVLYAKWIENEPEIPPVSAKEFRDVLESSWFFSDVDWAYTNNLMIGVSNSLFEPNLRVTQGMVVTVLARLAGVDTDKYKSFIIPDAPEDSWYTPFAKWAYAEGFLEDLDFDMNDDITREDIGIIIYRFLNYLSVNYTVDDFYHIFLDKDLISDKAMQALQTLYKLRILKGTGINTIEPGRATTRSELAALLRRVDKFVRENSTKDTLEYNLLDT